MEPAAPTTDLVTFPPVPTTPLAVLVTAPVTVPESLTTPVTVLATVPVTPLALAAVRVAVLVTLLVTLPTVLPTEVTAEAAALVVPLAADVTWLAAVATGEAAEVTREAAQVTAGTDPVDEPTVSVTVPDTLNTREPSPLGEAWVAALAGPASSRPMPNATHRPPNTAPQVYNNTLRASRHQPFMPATLIHPEH